MNANCPACKKDFVKTSNRSVYCSARCRGVKRWERIKVNPRWRTKALKSSREAVRRRKDARWEVLFQKHGNKCSRCGRKYPRCCYDLHHSALGGKRSKKDWSAVVMHSGTNAEFAMLVPLVEIICANCHRIEHQNGKPYGK